MSVPSTPEWHVRVRIATSDELTDLLPAVQPCRKDTPQRRPRATTERPNLQRSSVAGGLQSVGASGAGMDVLSLLRVMRLARLRSSSQLDAYFFKHCLAAGEDRVILQHFLAANRRNPEPLLGSRSVGCQTTEERLSGLAIADGALPVTDRSILLWFPVSVTLLAIALSCKRRLDTLLLTRFQIKCVTLDLLDDVLLKDLSLEAPESAIQALTSVQLNFSQRNSLQFPICGNRSFSVTASRRTLRLHSYN
jgi:hypothetical protein